MQLIAYAKYVRRERPWIIGVVVVSSSFTYAISGESMSAKRCERPDSPSHPTPYTSHPPGQHTL